MKRITPEQKFIRAFDKYIEIKRQFVSKNQIKDYNTLYKHLFNFAEHSSQPITFGNLNLCFYDEFVDYLNCKVVQIDGKTIGLKLNTVGKMIRVLKGFVNYEIRSKHIEHIDLSFFRVPSEEADTIYLSEVELARIYHLDLHTNQSLDRIRDLFIVGCYTGLRYSDLSCLNFQHIDQVKGNIIIRQRKVNKIVIIPMIDYVPAIMAKYNYSLPKVYSAKFNIGVKKIGQLAKVKQPVEVTHRKGTNRIIQQFHKWELISSHTCRRSFCTNMYLAGLQPDTLRLISGHKSAEAFKRYIRISGEQAADELRALRKKRK